MIFAPNWKKTADIVRSEAIFLPIAMAYLFLLLNSWQPDTLALILPGNLEAGLSGRSRLSQALISFHPYLCSFVSNSEKALTEDDSTRPDLLADLKSCPRELQETCTQIHQLGVVPAVGGFTPQFIPSLEGIVTLFSRFVTAASLWVHLVAINTFAATRTFLEGAYPPAGKLRYPSASHHLLN